MNCPCGGQLIWVGSLANPIGVRCQTCGIFLSEPPGPEDSEVCTERPVEQKAPFPYGSDVDPNNPVDVSAEAWREIYSEMEDPDDFIDRDESMNG